MSKAAKKPMRVWMVMDNYNNSWAVYDNRARARRRIPQISRFGKSFAPYRVVEFVEVKPKRKGKRAK